MVESGASIPAILCIGEDLQLLETRAAVLRKVGAEVKWANSFDALRFAEPQACDLIVLCHTVKDADAERISALARRRRPPSLILQLTPLAACRHNRPGVFCDAIADATPDALIPTVSELLAKRNGAAMPFEPAADAAARISLPRLKAS